MCLKDKLCVLQKMELEKSDIHWFSVDEETLRLREITMLEWAHYVKLYPLNEKAKKTYPSLIP